MAHDRGVEKGVAHTEAGIDREIRRDAREAWRTVRSQYPNKAFTAEFHDGFVDGYVDYLDRGGDPQPPAVPPPRYTRNKKYFTPEGHVLIRDYFLGFKYGVDVAVATGHRQYLTVPVLIPDQSDAPESVVPEVSLPPQPTSPFTKSAPAPSSLPAPRSLPAESAVTASPSTASPLPAPRALPADGTTQTPPLDLGVSKFGSATKAVSPDPDPKVPPAVPAIPAPPLPGTGTISAPAGLVTPTPVGEQPVSKFSVPKPTAIMPVPDLTVKVPAPPPEVPDRPAGAPASSAEGDLPLLPPNFTIPPPLPANSPDAVRR
jgi:hypothetical protein